MRSFAVLLVLALLASRASAQEQEDKLIDRVLKPNMTLKNSAQNKQFIAPATSANKKANASAFYVSKTSIAKAFNGERSFAASSFRTQRFVRADSAADLSSRSVLRNAQSSYASRSAPTFRASDNGKAAGVSEFSGSRPFLGRGKSQKALSAHDKPMTIEEVRELLNKNK